MIDLSPQPQDKSSGTKAAPAVPQHDPVLRENGDGKGARQWWQFSHEGAEAAIQRLSRWAGPIALLLALCLLGWWIIR
ncbi:hypothetical protein VVT58_04215 [Sphingobium sp. SJ10-10]|uniref:hypothetical protein n=1 Tax=unclassified Sphingobium TaxID=2611147 RepID=UPI00076FF244|nr:MULTISPECIES: hypothetical protein [Sphingomonadaceae]AMK23663.1 hypothetical protein K426_13655 [Sphingobium sp. TKS]MEC6700871.1 hypothetical protein [Sphingobium sp. SJ10-10]NML89426.1 hypothetical protein [Sphingobium sp. TB-6]